MKTLYLLLALPLALMSCSSSGDSGNSGAGNQKGKYQIESGILTFESSLPQDMGKNTRVIYFDDYGNQEKMVTTTSISIMGQHISTVTHLLTKDGYSYTWTPDDSAGLKVEVDDKFDPAAADFNKLTDEMMQQYGITKEGKEKVDDKNCDVYGLDYEGVQGKVWIWNNIPVKTSATMMGFTIMEKLISIEEVPVESSNFELPDRQWTDMTHATDSISN